MDEKTVERGSDEHYQIYLDSLCDDVAPLTKEEFLESLIADEE